jgi:hypothetical protein
MGEFKGRLGATMQAMRNHTSRGWAVKLVREAKLLDIPIPQPLPTDPFTIVFYAVKRATRRRRHLFHATPRPHGSRKAPLIRGRYGGAKAAGRQPCPKCWVIP